MMQRFFKKDFIAAGIFLLLILAAHTALVAIPAFLIRAKAKAKEESQ